MANSFDNKGSELSPGKQAFDYVIRKFVGLSSKYWTALLIGVIVFIAGYVYLGNPEMILQLIGQIIPEVFCLNLCGIVGIEVNVATWYISAMLICMLPLSYFLAQNKSFFFMSWRHALLCLHGDGCLIKKTLLWVEKSFTVCLWVDSFLGSVELLSE